MRIPQTKVNMYLGGAKAQLGRAQFYIGIFNFVMLAYITWVTNLSYQYPFLGNFIVFFVVLNLLLFVLMVIDYIFILPSEVGFGNIQVAKHTNPIYEEIIAFRKEMNEFREEIRKKDRE